jgi:hypothetical protein
LCHLHDTVTSTQLVLHSHLYTVGTTQSPLHSWYYTVTSIQLVLHSHLHTVGTTHSPPYSWYYTVTSTQLVLHSHLHRVCSSQVVVISAACCGPTLFYSHALLQLAATQPFHRNTAHNPCIFCPSFRGTSTPKPEFNFLFPHNPMFSI